MNSSSSDSKYNGSLVSCVFNGQLGNQLFTVAATLAYAWEYDAVPTFPGLHTEHYRTSYNRDRIFFRLDCNIPPRNFLNTHNEKTFCYYEKIPFKEDLIINGFYQSWKYFHGYRDRILEIFSPKPSISNYINEKYSEIIKNPNTVAVHVRTQGKGIHDTLPFLGLEYSEHAMNQFSSNSQFIVFSDRINWTKNKLNTVNKNVVFIEGNDAIEDLYLMSKCKHTIIANSTFSWWAAYMNQNPNKRVICPDYWGGIPPIRLDDLYLPEWEISPIFYLAPFPEDMLLYDKTSQSVDNNQT